MDEHAVIYYYTIYKGNNSLISLCPKNAHYRVRKRDTLRHSTAFQSSVPLQFNDAWLDLTIANSK